MLDNHPTVSIDFIKEQIGLSNKVQSVITIGNTDAYVIFGNKSISRRTFLIRDTGDGEVDFNYATGLAMKLNFMPQLLDWLETNKKWKSGAYII